MLFNHFEEKNYIFDKKYMTRQKLFLQLISRNLNETNPNPKIAKYFPISSFDNNHF